jgi:AcrR family transcriptional regulator
MARQAGQRRDEILQALADMLESPDTGKITTAALAARLEVSEAALYRHFPSKARMYEGLIEFIESTLFGPEKGSFSGATDRRVGLVEAADGGTLFLDELGELPLEAQTRLLRMIEARTFRRIGSTKDLKANVRFVSATHRDLPAMVSKGSFRADLFFRLATARVRIPPLRERIDDLPELVVALAKRMELAPPKLDETTLALLSKRPWPGNVRELRNLVELLGATVPDGRVTRAHLDALPPTSFAAPPPAPAPVREEIRQPSQAEGVPALFRDEKERANEAFERAYLARVLALCWQRGDGRFAPTFASPASGPGRCARSRALATARLAMSTRSAPRFAAPAAPRPFGTWGGIAVAVVDTNAAGGCCLAVRPASRDVLLTAAGAAFAATSLRDTSG